MRILNSCVAGLPICFLKPDFEILAFLTPLAFFGSQKNLAYFQSDRIGSGKTLSELHTHSESLATRVYYHVGCTEYCKNFTVCPKNYRCYW